MSDEFLTQFLGTPAEGEGIALPSGEGFGAGFIGPVTAAVLWRFWSADKLDPAEWVGDKEGRKGFTSWGRESSWFYYFRDKDEAKEAADHLGSFVNQVWRFEIPTAEVVNFFQDDPHSVWRATVGGDARITILRSKYRGEFHMLALPSAVQALALRVGYLDKPIFNLTELLNTQQFTDEVQAHFIGIDNEDYPQSSLWCARANLWAALGEENPLVYNPKGTGTKFDTESDKLSAMLGIVTRPWVKPVWGRLTLCPNPRVDATYGDESKRLTVPVLQEIYADEAAARVAAASEAPAEGKGAASKAKGHAVPTDWAGFEPDWRAELAKHKTTASGKLPPPPALAKMAGELSCSVEDIRAWWEVV